MQEGREKGGRGLPRLSLSHGVIFFSDSVSMIDPAECHRAAKNVYLRWDIDINLLNDVAV